MVVFLEESIVDHLNVLIPILNGIFMEDDEQKNCKEKAASILKLCGRFSPGQSFEPICLSIINLQTTENEDLAVCGLRTFRHLLDGYLEALPAGEGLLNKANLVDKVLCRLGEPEFLDHLSKASLNSFAELGGLLLTRICQQATAAEQRDVFEGRKSHVTRLCLTALAIPVYLLATDTVPELNFRLVKSCIDNTVKLSTDPDAQPYLKALSRLEQGDSRMLLGEIYSIDPATVSRASNSLLIIVSLMNYYAWRVQPDDFLDTGIVFETAAKDKPPLAKLILNLHCYFSFFVDHCY